jgi:asparaginyl-tRNA synthetase
VNDTVGTILLNHWLTCSSDPNRKRARLEVGGMTMNANRKHKLADAFPGKYGPISKERLAALVDIRAIAIDSIRNCFRSLGAAEATTATLVNVTGSCENPYASFPLEFYGGEVYLSQSAQLQLEPLVLRLRRGFFTQASSFRAENYDDPDNPGRRLSEFTLAEIEIPFNETDAETALDRLTSIIAGTIQSVVKDVLCMGQPQIELLGGRLSNLQGVLNNPFHTLDWDDAVRIVRRSDRSISETDDFSMRHERLILQEFDNAPVFVVKQLPKHKFFNTKRTKDGQRCLSVDLLLSPLGETVGGAIREERASTIRDHLEKSEVAAFIHQRNGSLADTFRSYFEILESEPPLLRGGFGIGFERLISFLTQSNDIIEAIKYRQVAAINR